MGPLYTGVGNVKWLQVLWKIIWRLLKKLRKNHHMIQQSHLSDLPIRIEIKISKRYSTPPVYESTTHNNQDVKTT